MLDIVWNMTKTGVNLISEGLLTKSLLYGDHWLYIISNQFIISKRTTTFIGLFKQFKTDDLSPGFINYINSHKIFFQ